MQKSLLFYITHTHQDLILMFLYILGCSGPRCDAPFFQEHRGQMWLSRLCLTYFYTTLTQCTIWYDIVQKGSILYSVCCSSNQLIDRSDPKTKYRSFNLETKLFTILRVFCLFFGRSYGSTILFRKLTDLYEVLFRMYLL